MNEKSKKTFKELSQKVTLYIVTPTLAAGLLLSGVHNEILKKENERDIATLESKVANLEDMNKQNADEIRFTKKTLYKTGYRVIELEDKQSEEQGYEQ